jgi:hypothetical protein
MLGQFQQLMQDVTGGNADPQAVAQAAEQHFQGTDTSQVRNQLATAQNNASQSGNQGLADAIGNALQRGNDRQSLINEAVSLVSQNPSILQHFEPSLAQGILSRFQSQQQ